MPVKSYLAFPQRNQFQAMLQKIKAIDSIEVLPAENRDVAVVVWEAADEKADKACWQRLEAIPEIQCLALVFGHSGLTV